ncbi:MAG: phenylalanine--tRNA ligase subunit beta, partial [Chloroflexi bacterium]|nr:phenylalanine--tRNA ligase subunit beta [Chloroflexota bacterium]
QKMQSSEAGYRFSRGVHSAMAERGLRRAIETMRRIAGGEVAKGIIDVYPRKPKKVVVEIATADVERILGLKLSVKEVVKILESLEFVCDISGQMSDTIPPQRANAALEREERVRDILVNAGLQEVITYRLTTPEREARLLPGDVPKDDRPYVTLANPIVADRISMRHSLLAGVLETLAANTRWRDRVALFEIGPVYLTGEDGPLPDESRRLAMALTGPRETASWRGSDAAAMDFYDLKGVIESLVDGLHLGGVSYTPADHPSYHPGRCAQMRLLPPNDDQSPIAGYRSLGYFGELHPLIREAYDLPAQPVLAAELDLEALLAAVPERHRTTSVPSFPPVLEDLAVIVEESVPGVKVESAIRAAGGELLAGLRLFDLYRGEQIGAGKKSLAYSLTYQAADRTLTDVEVAKVREKIVRRLKEELGATLRG